MNYGVLREVRRSRRIKQYELAAKVGIGPTQLCEIELGRREVTTELLAHISCVIESCGRQITKE